MCLKMKTADFVVCSEPVTCYKVFVRSHDGRLVTPFQRFPMNLGATYTDGAPLEILPSEVWHLLFGGAFHAYAYRVSAQRAAEALWEDAVVVKCEIPPATEIFSGNYGGSASFAAKTIKLLRIV